MPRPARTSHAGFNSYPFHSCLNRKMSAAAGMPGKGRGFAAATGYDSLGSSDSGFADDQMHQRPGPAGEDSAELERKYGAPHAHPHGVAARKRDDPACDCGSDGRVAEHGEPGAHGL